MRVMRVRLSRSILSSVRQKFSSMIEMVKARKSLRCSSARSSRAMTPSSVDTPYFLLGGFGDLTRTAIGQPLAADPLKQLVRALCIGDAECRAMVVAEIKLAHVAVKMLLANVMKRSHQSALEDREVAFHRVGRDVAARILARAMVHRLMLRKEAIQG